MSPRRRMSRRLATGFLALAVASGSAVSVRSATGLVRPSAIGNRALTPGHDSAALAVAEHPASNSPNPDHLPPDCLPKYVGPPYQLGLVAQISAGYLRAGPVSAEGISAKVCGVVTVVAGSPPCAAAARLVIPADGQRFAPLTARISLIPGMLPQVPVTVVPSPLSATLGCGSSQQGLSASTTADIDGFTGLFGLRCSIALRISLAGTVTGPIDSGTDLIGDFTGQFAIPAVAASPTCPAGVASNLNSIVGLPLPPGSATIALPFKASLYLPVPGQ